MDLSGKLCQCAGGRFGGCGATFTSPGAFDAHLTAGRCGGHPAGRWDAACAPMFHTYRRRAGVVWGRAPQLSLAGFSAAAWGAMRAVIVFGEGSDR